MDYLLIDAYNVINAWRDIFDLENEPLEDARERFLNILSNYQGFKDIEVIVVFDAQRVKSSQVKKEKYDNIKVVFTKANETADNYIERFVYINGETHRIRVVTSDYLEQTTILRKGGIRVLPRELREEIYNTRKQAKLGSGAPEHETNSIMSKLDVDTLTKLEKMRRDKF